MSFPGTRKTKFILRMYLNNAQDWKQSGSLLVLTAYVCSPAWQKYSCFCQKKWFLMKETLTSITGLVHSVREAVSTAK